jgi:hypothetical protein
MPLRHDGSGGTRSARPPASTPAQRTSHPKTLAAHRSRVRRDFGGPALAARASNLGFASTPAAVAPDAQIDAQTKVIEEATGRTPLAAPTRA